MGFNSATKEIFLDLLHMTAMFLTSAGRMPSQAFLDRESYERICRAREKKTAWQAMQRLKEQKILAIRERGNRIVLELSDFGKLEALKIHIRCKKQKLPAGEWCLVSFDVPERTRKTRSALRGFLKEVGFEQVHKSLWCSKKDLVVPLSELAKRMGAGSWMKVYRVREY